MKKVTFLLLAFLFLSGSGFAYTQTLLLDDFEGTISGGADGTVDFGAGGGSSVDVIADKEIKNSGEQSLKVDYDAVPGGYMWVARGFNLDASNADWLAKPEEITWADYNAFSFYMYGSNSGVNIAFDIKDNGNEMWRFFMITDDFAGWKQLVCPFEQFFARDDWQPQDADNNLNLDFPIKSFQFEPRPEAKGTLYLDQVELVE